MNNFALDVLHTYGRRAAAGIFFFFDDTTNCFINLQELSITKVSTLFFDKLSIIQPFFFNAQNFDKSVCPNPLHTTCTGTKDRWTWSVSPLCSAIQPGRILPSARLRPAEYWHLFRTKVWISPRLTGTCAKWRGKPSAAIRNLNLQS